MCSHKWIPKAGALLLAASLAINCFAAEKEKETEASTTVMNTGLLEPNSNRHIHPFSAEKVTGQFTTEGFRKIGQTEKLEIYLNEKEAALRILNKENGYIWGALPVGEAEEINATWRCYGNGLVSIECFNQEGIEGKFSIGKNGSASFEILDNGLLCSASFQEQGISFQVKVSWKDSEISMELVEGTLVEGQNESGFTLKSMTFMPFLGCSYSDSTDGYILIPDGSGALIRYRKPANYSSTYASRIYGKDYGVASISSTADLSARPEAQILMPVYGMVHGAHQNGYLAVIENGAEYATILASPAQTNNPYNWAAARFEFRQKYVKNINRKEGAGANVPQEVPNKVMPKISFHFTKEEQAHYDGMAVMYRQMLIDQGVLTPLALKDNGVPLQLEVLGADKKNNFLWDTTSVFTTTEQAESIRKSLEDAGITNLDMVYRYYTKNNECGKNFQHSIGSEQAFENLRQALGEHGGSLYFYVDPITANEDQITLRTEAANNLSKMEIKWSNPTASVSSPYTYLYRMTEAEKRMEDVMQRNYCGMLAIGEISNKLYGDFTSGKVITRAECLAKTMDMLSTAADNEKLAMYRPNQYLWQLTDKVFDMPITNSQIMYESDSVPFVQIVLSGCMEMYGSSVNTSFFSRERLLRQIEYGMAPAFTVTGCESMELYNTPLESYFSTCYEDWKPQIMEAHSLISEGLSKVWGHSIVAHDCLQTGVVRVEYDNGVRIYVNYTNDTVSVDHVAVEAGSFTVVGGA